MNHSDSMSSVRVRFAPSPTGHLHIGGLRAALFNWLFARHHGGVFLLRVEDTDRERSRQEFTESILESMAWCGLSADEPIVYQAARQGEHLKVAEELVKNGSAYRCYCSQQELSQRLGVNAADGEGYVLYDGKCRENTTIFDKPSVIRCKVPRDQAAIIVNDILRGEIAFPTDTIDDFIIVRSDGSPMYNFVVTVDDAFMRITHVIRGEEHLVNTPKQLILYRAYGYTPPVFAHLPLILGPDGTKLSKRNAATGVIEYKQAGYLPDALCNYLVRLGWSHGDQEIFTRAEMIQFFSLEHVGAKSSIFDIEKLKWVNSVYIKQCSAQQLYQSIITDVIPDFKNKITRWSSEQVDALLLLYRERVTTLRELGEIIINLQYAPEISGHDALQNLSERQRLALRSFNESIKKLSVYNRLHLEQLIKNIGVEYQLKMPEIAQPLRLLLTGTISAPGIYDLLLIVGREESYHRISRC